LRCPIAPLIVADFFFRNQLRQSCVVVFQEAEMKLCIAPLQGNSELSRRLRQTVEGKGPPHPRPIDTERICEPVLPIVNLCQTHAIPADSLDLRRALTDFSSGKIDLNDSLRVDICHQRQYKLLTHDSDFQFGGIDVLTLNRKLLQACR
jgi:hypothetical protein